ncbi:hypothetical protein QT231_20600 [Halomonas sp. SpR1]|uniref:hypothetical protein n=1 Tax=Halomonas sp. SpR1 TaxID=3050462 RepID=UPI0027E4D694|nr:hypothetical protein [Halomonas sp. SpR1]MDQ7735106.1 hypothetical protein [Halomonas sp. SpR1]
MSSQGDSKPNKTSETSLSVPSTEGSGKGRSNQPLAEEANDTSRGAQKHFLNHREAEAGGPADCAACGEEDPGVALEMLVGNTDEKTNR